MTTVEIGFQWAPLPTPLPGQLVYMASDYAIDFVIESEIQEREQALWDQGCSISLQTLELHVACQSRRVLFPRGYFPDTMWRTGNLPVPVTVPGLVTSVPQVFLAGVARPLIEADGWVCIYDSATGWIRFGRDLHPVAGSTIVEFAAGAALELTDRCAVALWLHPKLVIAE